MGWGGWLISSAAPVPNWGRSSSSTRSPMILSLNRASSRPGHHGVERGRHCSACREVGAYD